MLRPDPVYGKRDEEVRKKRKKRILREKI